MLDEMWSEGGKERRGKERSESSSDEGEGGRTWHRPILGFF